MANARVRSRWRTFGRVAAVAALLVAATLWAIGRWVVPGLLVKEIQKVHRGRVVLRGWRLGWRSAGLGGISLSEGQAKTDPVWAEIGRIDVDLGILDLLRGKRLPTNVVVTNLKLTYRVNEKGIPLTIPPIQFDTATATPQIPLPNVSVRNLDLAFLQDGRPHFLAKGIQARLTPDPATKNLGGILSGKLDDSYWGKWTIVGRVAPGFKTGDFTLSGGCPTTNMEKLLSIPFVPSVVWTHVTADGPMEASLFLAFDLKSKTTPITTKTTVVSRGATLGLPNLNLNLVDSTGSATVDGGVVTFTALQGNAIGGQMSGDGNLSWVSDVPMLHLNLRLNRLEVARLREKWLPTAPRIDGTLVGGADLAIAFTEGTIDLTGTSGTAEILNAMVVGLPVEHLRLSLAKERTVAADLPETPLIPGSRIPGTLGASGEFNAIEAREAVDRLVALGVISPLPVSGKLNVRFDVRTPLDGRLKRAAGYKVFAVASLAEGSLFDVPVQALSGRFDLDRGVLTFNDVKGRLAPAKDPKAGPQLAFTGFGGIAVDPREELAFHIETNPFSPAALAEVLGSQAVPVAGTVSLDVNAHADAAHLTDPLAWNGNGLLISDRLASTAETGPKLFVADLKAPIEIADGRLSIPSLAASLEGEPLYASLGVGLKAPFAFAANVDLPRRDLLVWLDRLEANPLDAGGFDGLLSARIESSGTLRPFASTVEGSGLLANLRKGNTNIGDVPFRFELPEVGRLVVHVLNARTFGGVVSGEVRAPIGRLADPSRGIDGWATLKSVDLHRIFALVPVDRLPAISGRADGRVEFLVPPLPKGELPPPLPESAKNGDPSSTSTLAKLDRDDARINLILHAPDLVVGGTKADRIDATAWVRKRNVHYDVLARGFGGKVKLVGDARMQGAGFGSVAGTSAKLNAAELDLADVFRAFKVESARPLSGVGSANVEMEATPSASAVWAKGDIRLRDLRWGSFGSLGRLNGRFEYDPKSWHLDNLDGRLFGGVVSGGAWTESSRAGASNSRFELAVDRADLAEVLAFEPRLSKLVRGFCSLKLAGRREDVARFDGMLTIPSATTAGVSLSSFIMPLEIETPLGSNIGSVRCRSFKGRIAGGGFRGDCSFRFGEDRSFHTKFVVSALELDTITRGLSNGRRPAAGRIQGTILIEGRDPSRPRDYRGRVDLDLDNGRLFELPVLKELGRLLGSKSGGLFDDGDLHATISNGELNVEQLTLQGKLLQLHVTGTVGFDQRLNLEVLVNTPDLIPETGQALISLIPGLGAVIGRREAASAKVGGYLSNKLLKFRVGGTLSNPAINIDPAVMVGEAAVGFFADVLKLPLNLLR